MREVMNPKTGEVIECKLSTTKAFERLEEKIKITTNGFISSLIDRYKKNTILSDAQWFCVYKIAQEEVEEIKLKEGFTNKLQQAFLKSNNQFPALHFTLCKVYMYRGSIKVKNENSPLGRIQDDIYYPSSKASNMIKEFIQSLSLDPFGIAINEGKKKGICCFCNRELTNTESVHRGYGPICADKYFLEYDYSNLKPVPERGVI